MAGIPSPAPNTVSSNYVRTRVIDGHFGEQIDSNPLDRVISAVNADPQTKEVKTATLGGGFSAGTPYTMSLLGYTVSYTSIAGDTDQNGVADSFAAAINADPDLRMTVTASTTGSSAVVTLTANEAGETFALASGTLTTAATVTSAAAALDIPFGRAVFLVGVSALAWSSADFLAKIADASGLAAQVDTIQVVTYSAASSVVMIFRDETDAVISTVTVAHNTNENTTAAAIETALDADLVLVGKGITAGVVTDTVTITAGTAGQQFSVEVITVAGAGVHAHTTTLDLDTSVFKSLLGVSLRRYDIPAGTVGDSSDTQYGAGAVLDILTEGKIWVELDTDETAPVLGGDVYVDTTAGAGAGRFYAIAGSGRFKIPGLKWGGAALSGQLGILEVSLA